MFKPNNLNEYVSTTHSNQILCDEHDKLMPDWRGGGGGGRNNTMVIEYNMFLIQENQRISAIGNSYTFDIKMCESGSLVMLRNTGRTGSGSDSLNNYNLNAYNSSSQQIILID